MPNTAKTALMAPVILAPLFLLSGCIVHTRTVEPAPPAVAVAVPEPVEGYYDTEHHRWYHEHRWVECDDRDPHCPPP
jgi:hypothetical protein